MLIRAYNQQIFPFQKKVRQIFGMELERLHEVYLPASKENDQDSDFHRDVYAGWARNLEEVYSKFIGAEILHRISQENWLIQRIPTFRYQPPGCKGTREFHRDRDYNHSPYTLNVVVPLTPMYETTAIHIEAFPYSSFYPTPQKMLPGDYMFFDGANLRHGTLENREGFSRVSFDFRLIPEKYLPLGNTVNSKISFKDYYRKV